MCFHLHIVKKATFSDLTNNLENKKKRNPRVEHPNYHKLHVVICMTMISVAVYCVYIAYKVKDWAT